MRSRPYEGKVLALDVDGVLLDPNRGGLGRWDLALQAEFGIDPAALQERFFQRHWTAVATGEVGIEAPFAAALGDLGCEADVEDVLRCWFEADNHLQDVVVTAVAAWATGGARLVLATTQEHRRAAFLRQRFASVLPVELILYSAALGAQKPEAAFYQAASTTLATEGFPSQVVFIDDLLANVEAARRHGWTAIHLDGAASWREDVETALLA